MDKWINKLLGEWEKKNIPGFFCAGKQQAVDKILEIIPVSATIGISGSVTLDQLGIVRRLQERGNRVFNQYQPGITAEEKAALRNQGTQADYYLSSANAVSKNGELVFLSAYGHRIAGLANAKNVLLVCGINKLTADLDAALKRAKGYATALNFQRLNWPKDKRMCCQVLIIEGETDPGRLKVILVGEELGY